MGGPNRVELTLLGQTLTIRTDAGPDYVRSLARYVEGRVADAARSGVKDPWKAMALAALDIADELFREREGAARREGDVDARLQTLLALLDEATRIESSREA
jgi:cell division protein ZapA (FtsZ GTPase activity inhibitor)